MSHTHSRTTCPFGSSTCQAGCVQQSITQANQARQQANPPHTTGARREERPTEIVAAPSSTQAMSAATSEPRGAQSKGAQHAQKCPTTRTNFSAHTPITTLLAQGATAQTIGCRRQQRTHPIQAPQRAWLDSCETLTSSSARLICICHQPLEWVLVKGHHPFTSRTKNIWAIVGAPGCSAKPHPSSPTWTFLCAVDRWSLCCCLFSWACMSRFNRSCGVSFFPVVAPSPPPWSKSKSSSWGQG